MNRSSFDYSALKEIEDTLVKKYADISRAKIEKMINDIILIVKTYRICRSNLAMMIRGTEGEKKVQ